jgi:hypothetical protein
MMHAKNISLILNLYLRYLSLLSGPRDRDRDRLLLLSDLAGEGEGVLLLIETGLLLTGTSFAWASRAGDGDRVLRRLSTRGSPSLEDLDRDLRRRSRRFSGECLLSVRGLSRGRLRCVSSFSGSVVFCLTRFKAASSSVILFWCCIRI